MNNHLCNWLYDARILPKRIEKKKAIVCIQDTLAFFFCVWLEKKHRSIKLHSTKNQRGWTDCRSGGRKCYFRMPGSEVAATLYVVQEHVMIIAWWKFTFSSSLTPATAAGKSPTPLFFHPFLSFESVPISSLQLHLHLPHLLDHRPPIRLSSRPITFHHAGYPFCHKWPSAFNKTRGASEAGVVKHSPPRRPPRRSAAVMESGVRKLYFPRGHSSILWVICST